MKQSLLKTFSIAYNKLQYAYTQGLISYPRVANDYLSHKEIKFYEYPHRPMCQFDEYSTPLQKDEYRIEKATLPLLLTHKNISTPATLYKNLQFVDQFISDDMSLRPNALSIEEPLQRAMEIIRDEASDLYEFEVTNNICYAEIDMETYRDEKSDEDLLSFLSKDGEVLNEFSPHVAVYSISLSPDIEQTLSVESDSDSEGGAAGGAECENDQTPVPQELPRAYKISTSPSRNYTTAITKNNIYVDSMEEFIFLENVRQGNVSIKEKLDEAAKKRELMIFNSKKNEMEMIF